MLLKIIFTDNVVLIKEVESVECTPDKEGIRIRGYTFRAKIVSVYVDGHRVEHIDVEDLK